MDANDLNVICAEFSGGQPKPGVELAYHGILQKLQFQNVGHVKVNKPEIDQLDLRIKNSLWTGEFCRELHKQVGESDGKFVLTLGGDHSIAIGSISAMANKYEDLCVIWVDAHADLHTASSTPSGNLHGCPVSFLLGLEKPIEGFEWMNRAYLKPQNLVYIGLRDLEDYEKETIQKLNIKSFSMRDIDELGIAQVMKETLQHLNGKIHLSFDIDVLDPLHAASTGTAVHGGLTLREGRYICESLAESQRLVSMDLVEVNLALGTQEDQIKTLESAEIILNAALGRKLL